MASAVRTNNDRDAFSPGESFHRSSTPTTPEYSTTRDELERARRKVRRLEHELREEPSSGGAVGEEQDGRDAELIGKSTALREAIERAHQVAPTDATVLITGETGTGKELIAHEVHRRSSRRHRRFVTVNVAALPSTLIESEFFGHEKGAFTGALLTKAGRFELANGGTILLDEIGELPLELQPKLLRVLQDGEFERLGATRTTKVDVRVIASTNRDLESAVNNGTFRSDLYYRLKVFPIHMAALRERPEDIEVLVWYFISRYRARLGKVVEDVPKRVMDELVSYAWPGNVRELKHLVERAMIISAGRQLKLDGSLGLRPEGFDPKMTRLDDVERAHILRVLSACGGKLKGKGNAADQLGLNPSTLRSRMKKLGIHRSARVHHENGRHVAHSTL